MRTMSRETERVMLSLKANDLHRFMDSKDETRAFETKTGEIIRLRKVHPEPTGGDSLLSELVPYLVYLGVCWWVLR